MPAARALTLVNGWETVRYELLNTRLCDLDLHIEGSPVDPHIQRLYRELRAKKLYGFEPPFYLTDGWGCPNEVPIIGIPFYLTDKRLARIEEEQTGDVEDEQMIMMLLRHEAGHAINYAYRLWEYPGWTEAFGNFARPYRDTFRPNPFSRQFVRHLVHHQHGRTYAQKHPDEDFSETFAVWLTPRSSWRRKYQYWPAIKKLKFVDRLMQRIRDVEPRMLGGDPFEPICDMRILLAEHYGQRAERFRAAAQGYVDDKLKEVFPITRHRTQVPAGDLLRKHHEDFLSKVTRWSGLDQEEVRIILAKLEDRSDALGLSFPRGQLGVKLLDVTALATSLAMDFAYTGRLTG
jgi:hypothetical protein